MWGSFGVSIDLPKLDDSDLTMEAMLKTDPVIEAILKTDPKMEVAPKLISY